MLKQRTAKLKRLLQVGRAQSKVVISFFLGVSFTLGVQAGLKNQIISEKTEKEAENIKISDSLGTPFWEPVLSSDDSLGLNFEILNIEPEQAPIITDEKVDQILSDFENRVSKDFEIPSLIFNQTKFWFRIYTEFDANKKVIHDSLHPHIIYDVVDIGEIMAQPARFSWINAEKAQKFVSKRVAEIQAKLRKMARKKKEDMDDEELVWLSQFEEIKGSQAKIITQASQNLRVQTGQKNFFENGLTVSNRYLEGMEKIFREKNLPVELTRLPFVESSFVIGATSKVGAAGIWQFMPGIGRQFMMINDHIDERRNPWKATEAAAKLLKENHLILHKRWGLALTAYNHGPGGVKRAIEAVGSKDIEKIVKTYRSRNFDFASANFYTCFLAALYAHAYRDLIWPDHSYEPTLAFDSLKLKKSMKAQQLAQLLGLDSEKILHYNPELDRVFKRNLIVPQGYRIFLPSEAKELVQNSVAVKSLEYIN